MQFIVQIHFKDYQTLNLIFQMKTRFLGTFFSVALMSLVSFQPLLASPSCRDHFYPLFPTQASHTDVLEMTALDLKIWGPEMGATPNRLQSRIDTFPAGQLVIRDGDQVLGFISSQRISSRIDYRSPNTNWPNVTGNGFIAETHIPKGPVLFLINISVDHSMGSSQKSRSAIGELLINGILEVARNENVDVVEGITRLNGFKKFLESQNYGSQEQQVTEYIQQVVSGKIKDPALSFHLSRGASVVAPIKNAMPHDKDSLEWGALIVYKIHK